MLYIKREKWLFYCLRRYRHFDALQSELVNLYLLRAYTMFATLFQNPLLCHEMDFLIRLRPKWENKNTSKIATAPIKLEVHYFRECFFYADYFSAHGTSTSSDDVSSKLFVWKLLNRNCSMKLNTFVWILFISAIFF